MNITHYRYPFYYTYDEARAVRKLKEYGYSSTKHSSWDFEAAVDLFTFTLS